MKTQKKVITSLLLVSACAVSANAFSVSRDVRDHSRQKFALCDVHQLADELKSGTVYKGDHVNFSVKYIPDDEANYNYYMILNKALNADKIRYAVCNYINKHHCHLYWGNVLHIAMIASKRAPVFPLDSSPHYMLSPDITCNKYLEKK